MRALEGGDLWFLAWSARWTVALSLTAFAGGGVLGLVLALVRTAALKPLRLSAAGWIAVFQGTPLVMQLFLVFFGTTLFGLRVDPWVAAAIALALNAGAFLGEIWRSAIETIPPGQWEAGRALGLHYVAIMARVVLPQGARIAIPPTVGFMVQLVKSTSLASFIGFTELTRAGQIVNNATFRPFLVFSLVGLVYFLLCWPLSLSAARLEGRLAAATRRTPTKGKR
ncbi:MAG: amino acid ABC transporter permease [Acetobacteraceae bacterium]|nr:amino acid ABC transporter permease [Acetobacteraceae bacterium]